MIRLLHSEVKRLLHSRILLGLFLFIAVASLVYSGHQFGGLPENMGSSLATAGLVATRGEYAFVRSISDSSLSGWLAIVMAALLIGMDFQTRMINRPIYAGFSRLSVLAVKLLLFYAVSCLLLLLYPLIACLRYGVSWLASLDRAGWAFVWRCVGSRVLLDMGALSAGVLVSFILKDLIRPMIVTLMFTLALSLVIPQVSAAAGGSWLARAIRLYPLAQYPAIISPVYDLFGAAGANLPAALWVAAGMAAAAATASYLCFRRAELS